MSADATSGSYRIEPLKGPENYFTWRVQLMDILYDLSLWEYVAGTLTMPADPAQQEAWKKSDRKALTVIRLRVAPAMMTHVLSATTSKDAWDALSNVFNVQGPLTKVIARRKFLRY